MPEPGSYYRTKRLCLFHLSPILPEPRSYYRIKLPCFFYFTEILPEPRSHYRTKRLCLFHLSRILPEPRPYYRIKLPCLMFKNKKDKQMDSQLVRKSAKRATMSFLAEVTHLDCWIILYLQYHRSLFFITVNEGGPELPCMTGVYYNYYYCSYCFYCYYYQYYYYYYYYYYYCLLVNKRICFVKHIKMVHLTTHERRSIVGTMGH